MSWYDPPLRLAMTAAQFMTQKMIMARNTSDDTMADPILRQQKMLLYVLPVVFGARSLVSTWAPARPRASRSCCSSVGS